MKKSIAYLQKRTIQKRFLYPLVFILLLLPFLYFYEGVQMDGLQRAEGCSNRSEMILVKRWAADAWYETGRSVRVPERSFVRSSAIDCGLYINTDDIPIYPKETREHTHAKPNQKYPEPGRSGWSLRAPPVVC